jgi:hypothetical protein
MYVLLQVYTHKHTYIHIDSETVNKIVLVNLRRLQEEGEVGKKFKQIHIYMQII